MNTNYRILNNQDYAADFREKINANFADLFANNVPTNHASTSNGYGLGSTTMFGHLKIQASNGLNVSNGVVSMSAATASTYGSVKLASSANSASTTDVVTSKVLNDALRGHSSIPNIYYGTADPSSTNPSGAQNGDIFIKYVQ